jgi:hypothetical protein
MGSVWCRVAHGGRRERGRDGGRDRRREGQGEWQEQWDRERRGREGETEGDGKGEKEKERERERQTNMKDPQTRYTFQEAHHFLNQVSPPIGPSSSDLINDEISAPTIHSPHQSPTS